MKKKKTLFEKKVLRPLTFWLVLEWIVGLYYKLIAHTTFKKVGFKSYKEPSIILCNHASIIDMANVVLSMFPYRTTWVASVEEFNGTEWLYRRLGIFPKRKFTTDLVMIKRIVDLINKRHLSVIIFPEARFSIAGVNEDIGTGLGKIAKLCKCRVIVIEQKGNYLRSPQWAKHPYRNIKCSVTATQVISKEEAISLPADEIQKRIEEHFVYDEYKYQYENKIATNCKVNAENIHRILYKCKNCNSETCMESKGNDLWCNKCHSLWHMNQYGALINESDKSETIVSDWYRWERDSAYKEVKDGTYHFESDCRIEHLVNSKEKFKHIGIVHMVHDYDGIHLKGTLDDGSEFNLDKHPKSTRSIHIEYNYKGRGDALDIATNDDTWFIYPLNKFDLTKFNFTVEEMFRYNSSKK